MKYRKKPIDVEAIQWNGSNHSAVVNNWDNDPRTADKYSIKTISGWADISVGDYIITEQDGVNYYPCKKEIFEATYDAAPKEATLTVFRKDYLFSKSPHGDGINIEIDGVKVLLPIHLILELMKC